MKNRLILFIFCLASHFATFGQTAFDEFKLTEQEIPEKYKTSEEILAKSIQPKIFYNNPDLYEGILGSVKSKGFQSFESQEDKGTVFFFEYEEKVEGEGFLEGLLWGGTKPTKDHPEEYLIKDNILIIWSFVRKSEIKDLSKQKIKRVL